MEQKTVVEVQCPRCGSSGRTRARQYIDVRADPRGRKDLLAGKLNMFRCRTCSFTDSLPVDVFYLDIEKEFCVQYAPHWRTEQDEFLDGLNESGQPGSFPGASGSDAPPYLRHVHLVLSMSELAAYVIFRERLWKRRAAASPGLVTCFSCDRSIEHGEHYFCVSRIVRERGSGGQAEDRVLDSTASLQVCTDCRRAAEKHPIAFSFAPLPLLNLEQEGFRRFARERGDWASLRAPDQPQDSTCSLCHTDIGGGESYIAVELSEETSGPEGVETLQVHAHMATLCGGCSEQYMVWLSMQDDAGQETGER